MYDRREGFRLGKYWEHEYTENVKQGSTVMVLFSTRKGKLPEAMKHITNVPPNVEVGVYFNPVGVVVISDEEECFSYTPVEEDPTAFGVTEVIEWEEPVITVEDSEGKEDNEGEGDADEPVL